MKCKLFSLIASSTLLYLDKISRKANKSIWDNCEGQWDITNSSWYRWLADFKHIANNSLKRACCVELKSHQHLIKRGQSTFSSCLSFWQMRCDVIWNLHTWHDKAVIYEITLIKDTCNVLNRNPIKSKCSSQLFVIKILQNILAVGIKGRQSLSFPFSIFSLKHTIWRLVIFTKNFIQIITKFIKFANIVTFFY